jgi:hypothetical protein
LAQGLSFVARLEPVETAAQSKGFGLGKKVLNRRKLRELKGRIGINPYSAEGE